MCNCSGPSGSLNSWAHAETLAVNSSVEAHMFRVTRSMWHHTALFGAERLLWGCVLSQLGPIVGLVQTCFVGLGSLMRRLRSGGEAGGLLSFEGGFGGLVLAGEGFGEEGVGFGV